MKGRRGGRIVPALFSISIPEALEFGGGKQSAKRRWTWVLMMKWPTHCTVAVGRQAVPKERGHK